MSCEISAYPEQLVRYRALRDGTPVTIRPIRPQDSGMEQEFVRHLSEDTRYFRFMGSLRELSSAKLKFFTEIDYDKHMAFVATVIRDQQELEIGVARYIATETAGVCEFAITVDDTWQGSGVAGMLMYSLQTAAREHGFKTMEGIVLASNYKMLRFARRLGFRCYHQPSEPDAVHLALRL